MPRISNPACGTGPADGIIDHRSAGHGLVSAGRPPHGWPPIRQGCSTRAPSRSLAWRLWVPRGCPLLREHAGAAGRCIPTTGQKPHRPEPEVRHNQRVGWTERITTELVEEI